MLYVVDGFDDASMAPLFASVIFRKMRATNTPKALRGLTQAMVERVRPVRSETARRRAARLAAVWSSSAAPRSGP
jgi:hypothetical protein